jgi:hypothetical protein
LGVKRDGKQQCCQKSKSDGYSGATHNGCRYKLRFSGIVGKKIRSGVNFFFFECWISVWGNEEASVSLLPDRRCAP